MADGTDCNDDTAPCGACADYCLSDCTINGGGIVYLPNHSPPIYPNTRQSNQIYNLATYSVQYKNGALDEFDGCSYFFWLDIANNWVLTQSGQPCRVSKGRIRAFQINCSTFELQDITQQIIEPMPGSNWQEDLTEEYFNNL